MEDIGKYRHKSNHIDINHERIKKSKGRVSQTWFKKWSPTTHGLQEVTVDSKIQTDWKDVKNVHANSNHKKVEVSILLDKL